MIVYDLILYETFRIGVVARGVQMPPRAALPPGGDNSFAVHRVNAVGG